MKNPLGRAWVQFRQRRRSQTQARRNHQALDAAARAGTVYFAAELAWLLGRDADWLAATAAEYCACPPAWRLLSGLRSASAATDGFAKTLDVAEGFALWALVKHLRPHVVVELGTQYGISARLWKEALRAYVPDHRLYLCDLHDRRRFIGNDESTMLEGDAAVTLRSLLDHQAIDLLHNDAHPYTLIKWSLREGLAHGVRCFTFHDVGGYALRGGPYLPASAAVPVDERPQHDTDWSRYGVWERHVMAEVFAPEITTQDAVETAQWRLQIFDSLFGFGAALRQSDRSG